MTDDTNTPRLAGCTTGSVAAILRLEGTLVLVLAVLAYGQVLHGGWGRFAALFLLPHAVQARAADPDSDSDSVPYYPEYPGLDPLPRTRCRRRR